MALEVETRDSSALTDADLDEMASMGGSFDIGLLSKAKEDWVLNTTARVDGKLQGFTFSTLERIGGTRLAFFDWMAIGLPVVIIMFVVFCLFVLANWLNRPRK